MPKEIELKLSLPANRIKQLLHLPLLDNLSISAFTKQKLHTIYYDTPNLTLKQQHCALRLRRAGKQWLQTIKTEGSAASGLHERDEWEVPVANNQLDFTQLSDPTMIKIFSNAELSKQLQPIFMTEFTRHTRMLQLREGSQIEFCLDHGKISANHAEEPLAEIELELKSGKAVELFHFALTLVQTLPWPLRLENMSKAERGYMLYTGYKVPPVKALPVVLRADMDLIAAFTLIAQNCLDQLTRNEYGVLSGGDIEYLHQMRVALRRLHAVFDVFSTVISSTSIVHELKWLTRQLNPARDWDVFIIEQLPWIQDIFPKHAGISALTKMSAIFCKRHHKIACTSIKSKRYTELILNLNLWLDEVCKYPIQPRHTKNTASTVLSTFTSTTLTNQHQHILKTSKEIEKLDATSLHALRISIKKQRYVTEFFHSLYSQEEVKRYLHTLSVLQDILGAINDCTNITKLLAEIPATKTKTLMLREAIGIILGWNSQRSEQKKTELKCALLAFYDTPLFWKAY